MQRQVTGALVATVVACLAAGCGSTGSGGSARVIAPACPADAPRSAPPGRSAGPDGLVRPGPVIAAICLYGQGRSAKRGLAPLRRIVLSGSAASGLAAVVDSGGPVTPSTRQCDRPSQLLPSSQVLVFGYPAGPVSRVSVARLSCDRAVVTSRGGSAVLGFAVAADLFAISTVPRRSSGPPTPQLIGLSAAEAAATARRHHFSVYFDGGAIDRAARFGTVVFQSLPAGLPDNGPGRQVDVIIAVQKSPPCQARQLSLSYLGGQPGAGNDFGTLLISDHAQRACALHGPLRVAGLDRAGRRVTSTAGFPLTGVTVLSRRVGAISHAGPEGALTGLAPGDLAGMIVLQAEYRDGPANVDSGLCMPDWVVPASWRVTLPDATSLSVANVDRRDPSLVPSGGFVTCRGRLGGIVPATVGSTRS